jgi:hypothetical protein
MTDSGTPARRAALAAERRKSWGISPTYLRTPPHSHFTPARAAPHFLHSQRPVPARTHRFLHARRKSFIGLPSSRVNTESVGFFFMTAARSSSSTSGVITTSRPSPFLVVPGQGGSCVQVHLSHLQAKTLTSLRCKRRRGAQEMSQFSNRGAQSRPHALGQTIRSPSLFACNKTADHILAYLRKFGAACHVSRRKRRVVEFVFEVHSDGSSTTDRATESSHAT